jgi:hypothetical protein
MRDFNRPQPFNVDLNAHEIADDNGPRFMPTPTVPYVIPAPVLVEPDTDLYPAQEHGVLPVKVVRIRR